MKNMNQVQIVRKVVDQLCRQTEYQLWIKVVYKVRFQSFYVRRQVEKKVVKKF